MMETVLVKSRTDNAKLARDVGDTVANTLFAGNVVKVDPLSVLCHNDALCTENHSEFARHKLIETVLDSREGEFICGLNAPAREYVVGVMMTVIVVVTVVVIVVALTFGIIALVVMIMMVVMLVLVAVTIMIVMMLMVVMVTLTFGIVALVVMIVMVVALALGIVTFVIVVMVMMTVLVMLVHKIVQALFKGVLAFCGGKNCLSVDLIPGSRNYRCVLIDGADYIDALLQLVFSDTVGTRKDDSGRIFYLIAVKFRKVLHIHLALACVDHRAKSRDRKIVTVRVFDCLDNVGKLTDARRLDNDSVGRKFLFDLRKRLAEITDERATDAARVHLGNFNAGLLEKSAVDSDLTELVFDKNDLLSRISFLDELLNKRGLSRAEEARIYIYFCHNILRIIISNKILYHLLNITSSDKENLLHFCALIDKWEKG